MSHRSTVRRVSQANYGLTLTQAKEHLRLEIEDNDDYVLGLIGVAHEFVQATIGRSITRAVYEMTLDGFPAGRRPIELPNPPLYGPDPQVRLAYRPDPANPQSALVELAEGTDYAIVGDAVPAVIVPPASKLWPMLSVRRYGTVVVQWQAGYGGPEDIPPQVRHAMLMLVSHYFEQRSSVAERPGQTVPMAVEALLASVSTGYYAQENPGLKPHQNPYTAGPSYVSVRP